ncbi:MAG: hypothetical protein RIR48_1940 [Bacteroidota bacterium]
MIYFDFVMINLGLFGSLMTTVFMTYERYVVSVLDSPVSLKSTIIRVAFSWIFIALILGLMVESQGDLIVVQPSGTLTCHGPRKKP